MHLQLMPKLPCGTNLTRGLPCQIPHRNGVPDQRQVAVLMAPHMRALPAGLWACQRRTKRRHVRLPGTSRVTRDGACEVHSGHPDATDAVPCNEATTSCSVTVGRPAQNIHIFLGAADDSGIVGTHGRVSMAVHSQHSMQTRTHREKRIATLGASAARI